MDDLDELDILIIDHVLPTISELKQWGPDDWYFAAVLCADFWNDLEVPPTVIGKRVKALSESGMLPIEIAEKTSGNKYKYRLK